MLADWPTTFLKRALVAAAAVVLVGCASLGSTDRQPDRSAADKAKPSAGSMVAVKPGGGYYDRDGPPEIAPADLARIPDAVPRNEALLARSNRPYSVFGQQYTPMTLRSSYKQAGIASWYGKQFHGRKTSSGETYDMLAMTAAHPTLPIPSYVRVTNTRNGKQVVVRVNDRGPFLQNRLIDLSFAAATKLDYVNSGHTQVEVELLRVDDNGDVLDEPVQTASAKVILAPAPAVTTVQPKPVLIAVPRTPVVTNAAKTDELALVSTYLDVSKEEPTRAESAKTANAAVGVSGGIYLQLGAFSSAENADSLVLKVARSLPALGNQLTVALDGNLHKIRAGPYVDGAAAAKVADMVQASTGYRPFQIQALIR